MTKGLFDRRSIVRPSKDVASILNSPDLEAVGNYSPTSLTSW